MKRAISLSRLGHRVLPHAAVEWIRVRHLAAWPPVGFLRWGSLRRLSPVSDVYGWNRGLPIDRHYIEAFVRQCGARGDIHGCILEVKEDLYASRFAQGRAVADVDIVDLDPHNARATIVGDLSLPTTVPREKYDCVICTQTLLVIYDFRAALASLFASLAPGGVMLLTVPGISRGVAEGDGDDYWRFTSTSTRHLLEELFPPESVQVEGYGNVLAATAALHGLSASELRPSELAQHDPRYEVVIAGRAVKPTAQA